MYDIVFIEREVIIMKVKDFLDERKPAFKTIRVLDKDTKKNLGQWWENGNADKKVVKIKATEKFLFLFI